MSGHASGSPTGGELLHIGDTAGLDLLARQMHDQLRRTGLAERHIVLELSAAFQLILRPGPAHQLQLVAVGYGIQFPAEWRAPLCAAFGVPAGTSPDFDLRKGYHIIKWTWSRVEAEQLSFVEEKTTTDSAYYKETTRKGKKK